MSSDEYLLKICIVGRGNLHVPLARRYCTGLVESNYLPTLGVDIVTKRIMVENHSVKLIFVLTAGQEYFGKLRPSYYRGASAAVFAYDTSDSQSFQSIPVYYEEFSDECTTTSIPIALVGIRPETKKKWSKRLKIFLRQLIKRENIPNGEVNSEQAQILAANYQADFYELFVTDAENFHQICCDLTRKVLKLIKKAR